MELGKKKGQILNYDGLIHGHGYLKSNFPFLSVNTAFLFTMSSKRVANEAKTQSGCTYLGRSFFFSVNPAEFIINKMAGYIYCWVVPCLGLEVDE